MAAYLGQSSPNAAHIYDSGMNKIQPEDTDQAIVQTPYGRGIVLRTRNDDNIKEVQLLEWESIARPSSRPNKPIMMYTSTNYPSVPPHVGDDVICSYGRGRVKQVTILPSASKSRKLPRIKYSIALSSWRLRSRANVTCHIISPPPRVVRKHTPSEMDAYEKVELAQSQKLKATEYFSKQKDYSLALNSYAGALEAVRDTQHDHSSTNEVRADLVVTMVTCSNNAATCCIKLKKWEEATRFAQNALILCDALLAKRGMKIHTILNKEGTIDAKLFGEWRVKSYLVIASSCIERDDQEGAAAVLKKAKIVAMGYIGDIKSKQESDISKEESASLKGLTSQMKEVRRLMNDCHEKKKEMKKLEKRRAQAMFSPTSKDSTIAAAEKVNGVASDAISSTSTEDQSADHEQNSETNNTDTPEEPSTPPVLKSVLSDKSTDRPSVKKSVSFSQKPPQVKEFDSAADNDSPWYSEHKEAFVLMAIAGLSMFAFTSLRRRSA